MNWEAVQAVAESAGALGVIASLVYLALQVRHNTASMKAATVARSAELLRGRQETWTDPETASFVGRTLSGESLADPSESGRGRLMWIDFARSYEAVYYQYVAGQLPESAWAPWREEIRISFSSPGGTVALEAMRASGYLGDDFARFVDELLAERRGDLGRFRQHWQDALERARESRPATGLGSPDA